MDEGRPRTLKNYVASNDSEPFRDYMKKLRDYAGRSKIDMRLNRIRLRGHFGVWKPIKNGDGVCELVVDTGPGYRVYFAEDVELDEIILLWAGVKRTQDADIARAKEYWGYYNAKT